LQTALTPPAAAAGFLSPASRGALLTALLVVYLLLAVGAGFGSVWLWGMIQRSYEGWPGVAWRCAAYFPGITLAAMSGLNVLLVHTGSSGAIPLGAFFSLIALWFLISIPLCFSGAARRAAPRALAWVLSWGSLLPSTLILPCFHKWAARLGPACCFAGLSTRERAGRCARRASALARRGGAFMSGGFSLQFIGVGTP